MRGNASGVHRLTARHEGQHREEQPLGLRRARARRPGPRSSSSARSRRAAHSRRRRRGRTAARTASPSRTCRRHRRRPRPRCPGSGRRGSRPAQKAASVEPPAKAKFHSALLARDRAEFEGDAAKHQRQQHHDHRQVERRHDHGVGARETRPAGRRRRAPARSRCRPRTARSSAIIWSRSLVVLGERKQDADAEIEAVEDDVERDRAADEPAQISGRSHSIASSLRSAHRAPRRRRPSVPAERRMTAGSSARARP